MVAYLLILALCGHGREAFHWAIMSRDPISQVLCSTDAAVRFNAVQLSDSGIIAINQPPEFDDASLHAALYKDSSRLYAPLPLDALGFEPGDIRLMSAAEHKIAEAARLVTRSGGWLDVGLAHALYVELKAQRSKYVVAGLVRQMLARPEDRARILRLAIKLGISGSEEQLVAILNEYGDSSMAEDYLNSGSPTLVRAGRAWAVERDYEVVRRSEHQQF